MSSTADIITDTPLGGGATYTEPWETVIFRPSPEGESRYFAGIAAADVAGTLYIEQSVDGVNVARSVSITIGADSDSYYGFSTIYEVLILAPYMRVKFVNGLAPQTKFVITRRYTRGM